MYKHFFKRLLDIIFSLLGLPFVLLVIIFVAPVIYLTDKGPIFYIANRMGKNGKIYTMYKLRSMKVNAPDLRNADGSTFNSENDPRVTPIGKFIRKTSIDELPQLLNILIGDMSLVGPRPTLATRAYTEFDEIRKKRVSVRPGVTGYSQAYYRNSISQDEKFKYDCYYIDNMSLTLDFKIIFKTVGSVLQHKNIFVEQDNTTTK